MQLHPFLLSNESLFTIREQSGDYFQELEAAFAKQELHPGDLKASVEKYLNGLLEPVRKTFETPELKKLVNSAYPPPAKVKPGQQAQVSHYLRNGKPLCLVFPSFT